ncbi:MAG: ORF6N domain-containing protein [Paludibacteraceae bacterium]|nr:ORF6N domain-containing protein [Paludibacteraceae bacterium]
MNKSIIRTTVQGTVKPQVYNVRGKRVVIDRDVAAYVGKSTGNLNLYVKRNIKLFDDEMWFKLSEEECLRLQIVIPNISRRGGSRYLPFVFTKEGISMLEKLLKRDIPIEFEEEAIEAEVLPESWTEGTVVLYQPNKDIKIDVRVEHETVWLTQEQMALLLGTKRQAISKHINNIYEVEELDKNQTCSILEQVQTEGEKYVARKISTTVYTNNKSLSDTQLQLDLAEANKKREAPLIQMLEIKHDHDRFLIIDNTSYLLGPSIKDAGVNRCAVVKMHTSPDKILKDLAVAEV